jgi:glucose-1-phosphate thymidylyltransferase
MSRRPVGVLPAGGQATRLKPFRYPKELMPVAYEPDGADGAVRPRGVIDYSVAAMVRAGVQRCITVVAPWKLEILRYLGGDDLGISMSYVCQEHPRGLAAAIDLAYPWTADDDVVMAMPDTVIRPGGFLATTVREHYRRRADLTLAVFPTDEADRLGPVLHDGGAVTLVEDKPQRPPARNTWGAAVWGPMFAELLHAAVAASAPDEEICLGHCFQAAVEKGLSVRAVEFPAGSFCDVGTPQGLGMLLGSTVAGDGRP